MGAYGLRLPGSVIFLPCIEAQEFAVIVHRKTEHDWTAAYIAILDVFLAAAGHVDVGFKRFSAVRTANGLVFQHGFGF